MIANAGMMIDCALRRDAAQGGIHRARLVPLVIVLFHMWVRSSDEPRELGAALFSQLFLIDGVLIVMLTGQVATQIRDDQQTRNLLKLAGIRPLGLLCLKTAVPLIQILLGLAVQLPLLALLWTLGVPLAGMAGGVLLLITFTIFCLTLAGLCGAVLRHGNLATFLHTLLLIGYLIAPWVVTTVSGPTAGVWLRPIEIMRELMSNLSFLNTAGGVVAFVSAPDGPARMAGIVVGHLGASLMMVVIAARTLDWLHDRSDLFVDEGVRGWLRPTRRPSRPAWPRAIAGKEFRFHGGIRWLIAKSALFAVLVCVWITSPKLLERAGMLESAAAILLLVLPLELAVMVANIISWEIRERTLGTLLLLPVSVREILREKLLGGGLAAIPSAGMFLVVAGVLAIRGEGLFGPGGLSSPAAVLLIATLLVHFVLYLHIILASSLDVGPGQAVVYGLMLHWGSVSLIVGVPAIIWNALKLPWPPLMNYVVGLAGLPVIAGITWLVNRGIPLVIADKAAEIEADPHAVPKGESPAAR